MGQQTLNGKTAMEIRLAEIGDTFASYRLINPPAERTILQSIRRYGQLCPVVVGQSDQGYELIDGFKRFRACRTLNHECIKATILQGNVRTYKAALVSLNWGSRSLADFEEALVLSSLVGDDCLTQKEIAVLFGRHKSWVCRRIALVERLHEEVIDQLKLGLVTTSIARELARLPRGNQEAALKTVVRSRLSCRKVAHLVTLLLERPAHEQQRLLLHPETFLKQDLSGQSWKRHVPNTANSYQATLTTIEELIRSIPVQDFLESLSLMSPQNRQQMFRVVEHIETHLSHLKPGSLEHQGGDRCL